MLNNNLRQHIHVYQVDLCVTVVQIHKVATAYLKSKQLLLLSFARQSRFNKSGKMNTIIEKQIEMNSISVTDLFSGGTVIRRQILTLTSKGVRFWRLKTILLKTVPALDELKILKGP